MEKETGVYCISKIRKEKPVPIFVARKLSIVQWLIPFWVAQTCGSREYKYSEGWWRKMPSVRSPSKSRGAHHAAVPSSSLPSGCSVAAGDEWIISDTAAKKLAYWPVSKEGEEGGGKLGLPHARPTFRFIKCNEWASFAGRRRRRRGRRASLLLVDGNRRITCWLLFSLSLSLSPSNGITVIDEEGKQRPEPLL